MFKARIKYTDEIIEAEDLKVIENIRSLEFACVDKNCNIPLIPSSFQEDNKKRPFFKKFKNQEHSPKCSYSKYMQFLEIGKTRRLTELEFEKLEYPSQLVMTQPKPKEMTPQLLMFYLNLNLLPQKKSRTVSSQTLLIQIERFHP